MHCHFFEDLFDTYQSLSTFMQLAWLVMPFAFICMMFANWLLHKRQSRELEAEIERRAVERYVLDLGSREAYAPPFLRTHSRPVLYRTGGKDDWSGAAGGNPNRLGLHLANLPSRGR